jgi:hypothetical protein
LIVGYGRQRHAFPSVSLHPFEGRGGGGDPSSKFLGLLWSSTAPARFFALPPISRSRRFLRGFPTIFRGPAHFLHFRVSPPILAWRPLSAKSGCLPRSGCHPRSVRHLTSVCPSPDNGLSVTRHRSVRHPTPRSVCHSTSVCPSPDFLPGRFHLAPSQSPSSEHGPGRLSGRSRPPSFQLGGWGLLSCSSVGGWPFSVPGGSAGFASASLSRSHWIYL